ncbi:MAG: FAD-dependent oxidoreductase [Alphaproteobacteria bacterium]
MQQISKQLAIVIGAGISGLAAALALGSLGWRVQVIERDSAPPSGGPEAAFADWARRGVAQMRHSHVFLSRLTNLMRDYYPDLLAEMHGAGCRILEFRDGLPPGLLENYVPVPQDADLSFVSSRRVTLELVLRRHVAGMPDVEIIQGSRVTGLLYDAQTSALRVTGVEMENSDGARRMDADLTIDASGRGSRCPAWLQKAGVTVAEESAPAGIFYFTRCVRPCRSRHGTIIQRLAISII